MNAEEERTEQMTKNKLIKEGQKPARDQTLDLLNNFKALLNNNINQDKGSQSGPSIKDANVASTQNVDVSNSVEKSEDTIKVLTEPSKIAQILRTPATTTTTTTTTTRSTTTTRTTTTTTTQAPDLVGQIVNGLSRGIGRLSSNMLTGAGFAAAAASPLWAPLLIGKKRRRRDLSTNEVHDTFIDYKIKSFGSSILQRL